MSTLPSQFSDDVLEAIRANRKARDDARARYMALTDLIERLQVIQVDLLDDRTGGKPVSYFDPTLGANGEGEAVTWTPYASQRLIDRADAIQELIKQGKAQKEIAADLGITPQAINEVLLGADRERQRLRAARREARKRAKAQAATDATETED